MKYDSILIVVDKFTKYVHLIFCNKKFTVKQIICVVLDRVIKYYGISESITSDKDKIFRNNFWKTLMAEIETRIKLLIVYYS